MALFRYVGFVIQPTLTWTWTATYSDVRNSGIAYINGVRHEYKDTTESAFLNCIADKFPWDNPNVIANPTSFGVLAHSNGSTIPKWGEIFPTSMRYRRFT